VEGAVPLLRGVEHLSGGAGRTGGCTLRQSPAQIDRQLGGGGLRTQEHGENGKILYVSGEESGSQIALRGKRLGVFHPGVLIYPETLLWRRSGASIRLLW